MGIAPCITQVNSYVLLQVRKDDQNRSNVDALIHKVVSNDQYDVLAKKLGRKHFQEPRKRDSRENEELREPEEPKAQDLMKTLAETKPEISASNLRIKPKVINLRSNQPSLMYEVDSNVLIKALKDFLSSKLVAKYTDDFAKKAAVVYRSATKGDNNY
ncbi:hypothetical protein ABMA27_012311 [Loxostege sticticalis]|uniref:Uncharacterized protein n=1 Tax=Loxostege sticticalis TaxID=481309 RepID=A0ABR3H167_LOXSC